MTSGNAPAITPSEILQRLWVTLAAPIATEVGAIVALMVTAVAGMVAGLIAVLVLGLVMLYIRPPDAVARIAILVAGPPLRYALLLVAVGKTWLVREQGPVPALLLPRPDAVARDGEEAEALAGGQDMVVLPAAVGIGPGPGVGIGLPVGVQPAVAVQVEGVHAVAVRYDHPLHELALAGRVGRRVGVDAAVEGLVLLRRDDVAGDSCEEHENSDATEGACL